MLNGHPSLMKIAAAKGVDVGMVPMPGQKDDSTRSTMGVADWMMAFKKNGHRGEVGDFLDFVYDEKNVLAFSLEYDLLPVTTSASKTMAIAAQDKDLAPFLDELPSAQLYPVGKTSWAQVSADIKARVGTAFTADGDPATVLTELQKQATSQESAE
jgi:multiple sugar transport system substrate-binding protein